MCACEKFEVMTDSTKKKITRWFWILLIAPVLLVVLLLCLVWAFADIPSIEELENPDSKLATQVIAEEGEILTTYHIENRTFVTYEELAPSLVQAAVATEDKRFYDHSGVDIQSLGRVLFRTLLSRDSTSLISNRSMRMHTLYLPSLLLSIPPVHFANSSAAVTSLSQMLQMLLILSQPLTKLLVGKSYGVVHRRKG